MLAAALSIRDPRERPEEHIDAGERGAQALRRAGQRPAVDPRPVGAPARASSGRCPATSSAGCAAPSTSTTCACASGTTCSASCARPPATSASGPARSRPSPDRIHQAVLAGLLSHIGMRDDDGRDLRGARGSTFTIARGSVLARKPPRWVMAAELVETNRLWARRVADDRAGLGRAPRRAPRAALVRRAALGRAARRGRDRGDRHAVRAADRQRAHRAVRPHRPRRRPLAVHPPRPRAAASGRRTTRSSSATGCSATASQGLEARVRRGHLLDDDELQRFYDERLPDDVTSGPPLRPVVQAASATPTRSTSPTTCSAGGAGFRAADYPDTWRAGRSRAAAVVPLRPRRAARRRRRARAADRAQPGDRRRASTGRSRATGPSSSAPSCASLPKDVRRELIPMNETIAAALGALGDAGRPARRRAGRRAARPGHRRAP